MNVPDDLGQYLAQLSEALDDGGTDLQAVLEVLVDDLTAGVPTFLGLRITVTQQHDNGDTDDGDPTAVTLDFLPAVLAGAVGTSLRVPMDTMGVPGAAVVLYAARPGAFTDLAADTRLAYGLDGQVVIDGHLPTPGSLVEPVGVGQRDRSTINQAIGILIRSGYPPEEARRILRHRAGQGGITALEAAQRIITAAAVKPPDPH